MCNMEEERKEKARTLAVYYHGDQKYGNSPYRVHLDAVADILAAYGTDAQVVAYLHDVLEDTAMPADQIEETFGSFVARCVRLITDAPGPSRKERKIKTYAKMAAVTGELELALIVKSADRLANLRASTGKNNRRLMQMYKEEHPRFKKAVYRPGLCESIWEEMDRIIRT